MHTTILSALDDITSSRSSLARRARALTALERVLADLCNSPRATNDGLEEFRRLQDAFETNIATRLLSFLTASLPSLDASLPSPSLSTPSTPSRPHSRLHHSPQPDPASLNSALTQSLTLLQGVCFLHAPSKAYLGRKAPLQLLLDILLLSRPHAALGVSSASVASTSLLDSRSPSTNYTAPSPVPLSPLEAPTPSPPPAASSIPLAVLDTLLSILVDSPRALRAFEDASGLEAVVRTLKRAGVPRDVRMRCLEFLYFYLLPESEEDTRSPSPAPDPPQRAQTSSPSPFLVPATPSQPNRRTPPLQPVPDLHAVPPLSNSRSSSASSASSFSTSPSPAMLARRPLPPALERAKEELETFVPSTPKKVKLARIGMGTPRHPGSAGSRQASHALPPLEEDAAHQGIPELCLTTPGKTGSMGMGTGMRGLGLDLAVKEREEPLCARVDPASSSVEKGQRIGERERIGDREREGWEGDTVGERMVRSTEEKRERLGAWLGNVDQLVEGVGRAGVWGLV
ncbi:hypothetical protein CALVIDRAFT_535657 [Calocera viscosa TUFC12733]|uniref:CDC14-domain-containing protein n=1 Tax=Calocera viscosa (strain TUFC12733) TaxID=1330018 RepID=A0A167NTJ5_CALVF|nr:hypothetical protein CALVIDRAFT_535657 [Calocera viscosa TUFC12733]